jgi:hypothetical protein
LYQPGSAKFVGTFTLPSLPRVKTESGTETPIVGILRYTGLERGIGFATYVGGGDFVCARRVASASTVVEAVVTPMLEAVSAVVVVWVETGGVAFNVVVVLVDVFGGEVMTTPLGGSVTSPKGAEIVGPLGGPCGTNTIPKIPAITKIRETANQII